jgi:hypothetical protein
MMIEDIVRKQILKSCNLYAGEVRRKKRKGAANVPGPNNPPKGISKKGLKHWPEFWKRHGKACSAPEDPLKKWAAAVAIWTNYAMKYNIPPFDAKESFLNQDAMDKMINRIVINRDKMYDKCFTFLKFMYNKGIMARCLKERIEEIRYTKTRSMYSMITSTVIILESGYTFKSREVDDFIKGRGFLRVRGGWEWVLGSHTVRVFPDKLPNRLIMQLSLNMTPQHIKYLLGVEEEDLKNRKKIIGLLSKEVKNLLKKKSLESKLFAAVEGKGNRDVSRIKRSKIDFSKTLEDKDAALLKEVVASLMEVGTDKLKETYPLEIVRQFGNPVYQYNFLRALVGIVARRNETPLESWRAAIESPEEYLDPRSIRKMEEEDAKDPESDV